MARLNDFLRNHFITDSANAVVTHTRIPNKQLTGSQHGGKFNINTKQETDAFYRLYLKEMFVDPKGTNEPVLRHPVPSYSAHMTEKQLDQGAPIMIDMDIKYDAHEVHGRKHSEQFCLDVIHVCVCTLFGEMADLDQLRSAHGGDGERPLTFFVFVTQKDDSVLDPKNPQTRKDGIHIKVGLALDRHHHIRLRELMLPHLSKLVEKHKLPIINSVDDVLDASVAKANAPWQLYGSSKPQCEPYKLSYQYKCTVRLDRQRDDSEGEGEGGDSNGAGAHRAPLRIQYETVYSRTPIGTDAVGGGKTGWLRLAHDADADADADADDSPRMTRAGPMRVSEDKRHHVYGAFCVADSFELLSARYDAHARVPICESVCAPPSSRASTSSTSRTRSANAPNANVPLNLNLTAMSLDLGPISNLDDNEAAVKRLLAFYHQNKFAQPNLFKTFVQDDPFDLQEIYDYLSILPDSYYAIGKGTYENWMRVGWALKNTSPCLYPLWLQFSSQAETFSDSDIMDLYQRWNSMQPQNKPDALPLTWKSIRYWARHENPTKANEVYKSNIHLFMEKKLCKEWNETDVAWVLHKMYGDLFVCADIKNNRWFVYDRHRWKENDCGAHLRDKITSEFDELLFQLIAQKESELTKKHDEADEAHGDDDDDAKKKYEKTLETHIKKLVTTSMFIRRTSHKGNIMTEAKYRFNKEKFMESLNQNPYLLGFENGVFDFREKQFRAGRPDDFLTISTKTNYVAIDRGNADDVRILQEIEEFFRQLFPDPEVCKYMWRHLASCMLGTCLQETINIYVGSGSNGKTKLAEFLKMALGEYYGDVPVALVTQPRGRVGGTTSEVAQLQFARYAMMQEPSKGDQINDGILKQLTGGDQINARELFQKAFSFKPMFKLVMATNNLPKIGATDNGIWRRIRVIQFVSTFVEVLYEKETKEQREHQFIKNKEIDVKFREWVGVFTARLIEIACETGGYVVDCKSVTMESDMYRSNQDQLMAFFKEFVTRDTSGAAKPPKITKKDLYIRFENWYKQHYGHNVPHGREIYDFMDANCGHHVKSAWSGFYLNTVNAEDDGDGDGDGDDN